MANILICGGSGHVGALLAEALAAQGHAVSTLAHDRSPSLRRLASLGILHHHLDLSGGADLRPAFDGAEVVINLVARVSFKDRDWDAVRPVNVDATARLLAACRAARVRRLIHFSSIDVFAGEPREALISEDSPLIPLDFPLAYPRSKRVGQQLIMDAMRAGMDAVLIYPTSIIGPGDYHLRSSNRILYLMATGRMPILLDAGLTVVDVRDVVDFTARAALAAAPGAAYLLTGPYAHFRDFAAALAAFSRRRHLPLALPLGLLELVAPIASRLSDWRGANSPLTRTALHGVSHYRHVSSQRAARDFGFKARDLTETVADTWHWFAAQGILQPDWRLDEAVHG